jgi:hypothetical protein
MLGNTKKGLRMIGVLAEHSGVFLRVVAVMTALLFSIPISLAPLAWARTLRWDVDSNPNLALYFGRCLGAVALVLSWAAWNAAQRAELQPFYFQMLIGVTVLMVIVHVVGALQRVQPWIETAEIVFWTALAVLALLFYPLL